MNKTLTRLLSICLFFVGISVLSIANAKPIKNGFDLADISIPANKVFIGGPPRDGIPSIDKPKFLAAGEADYLKDNDRVLGIYHFGEARAYPIRILDWHEIVNDKIQGRSVAVTYCPLCGSGIVYNAEIDGKSYEFGVSGLLYNSDVLLFDRETETLWSQILSKAVSGKLKDTELEIIQSSHTSWKTWKQKYPDSKVLSTETGFSRDYNRSPYGNYDNEVMTFFPIEFKSKRYHPKERVLGITLNGNQKVYPFAEISKNSDVIFTDEFAGEVLTVEYDAENRDGFVKNSKGEIVPSINTFWFAWYGFHPKGEIYTFK
ncbi:MAG: DUF3179 domain-containing protein [Cocleimonas sp.]